MGRDPNRPEPGTNLRDGERFLTSEASGDAGRDGYTVIARRPRAPGITETMDPEKADRIEGFYRDFPADPF